MIWQGIVHCLLVWNVWIITSWCFFLWNSMWICTKSTDSKCLYKLGKIQLLFLEGIFPTLKMLYTLILLLQNLMTKKMMTMRRSDIVFTLWVTKVNSIFFSGTVLLSVMLIEIPFKLVLENKADFPSVSSLVSSQLSASTHFSWLDKTLVRKNITT